jgi:hypothetical protein
MPEDLTLGSKRRRRRKALPEAELAPAEQKRRQQQRELRELALQLRAQGREYNPHKCKARVFREENAEVNPRPSQARKMGAASPADSAGFQVGSAAKYG